MVNNGLSDIKNKKTKSKKPANKAKTGGQNKHIPTAQNIKDVSLMVKCGVQTKYIAAEIGISEPTLFVHYKVVMDQARATAHKNIGLSIYNKALSGDTAAQIWYSKTQMGWSDKQNQSVLEKIGEEVVKQFHLPSNGRDTPTEQASTVKSKRGRKPKNANY